MNKAMTTILVALLASTAVTGCKAVSDNSAASQAANQNETEESAKLNAWFEEKFEEELAFSPIRQTFLGIKTDYNKIDDMSAEAEIKQLEWRRAAAKEMQDNFDYDKLSDTAKISWDMWLFRLNQAEAEAKFRDNGYVMHQFNGAQSFLPTFLINQHGVETEEDMSAYISRLSESGRALDQLLVRAQANAAAGTRPPKFAYEGVIDQSGKIITGAPFTDGPNSALWDATEEKLAKLVSDGVIDQGRSDILKEEARIAMVDKIKPAYTKIIDWYKADMANLPAPSFGVAGLPNGKDFYNARLANFTTTDLTADEIHDIGLSEVARIRTEMEAIKDQVKFDGDLDAFFKFMREDDQFYFSNDDKGAQDYIDAATKYIDDLKVKLPDYFGVLPKADLVVKRVEPFREQDGAAQHYRPGTPDGSKPGTYYAHLSDMRAMAIPPLEVIAYHEGLPGHHMQISIAQELEGVPKFRSTGGSISAFSEGWGLYSELLAKEMGAYEDPYSDFGRLTTEMWRSIRLVVDTGLHAKGWDEEKAVTYFLANSPIPETAVRSEVQRYLVLPGQATSYKIGMLKILELRKKAEDELGDKFDIRGFHDTVLGGGSVPLDILAKRVDQWVAQSKG